MPQIRAPHRVPESWLGSIVQQTTEFIPDLGPVAGPSACSVRGCGIGEKSRWPSGLSPPNICHRCWFGPLPTLPSSHGGTGKADGWGSCLWALSSRGATFPRPGRRGPRELADVGGLGRVHRERGPAEVLPFPPPRQCATPLHPSQPGHRLRGGQQGRLAVLA